MRRLHFVSGSRSYNHVDVREYARRLAPRIDLFERVCTHYKKQSGLRTKNISEPLNGLVRVRPVGRFEFDRRNGHSRLVERRQSCHRVAMIGVGNRARILVRRPVRRDDEQLIELEIPNDRARDFKVSVVYRIECPSKRCYPTFVHKVSGSWFLASGFWFLVSGFWFLVRNRACNANQKPE